MYMIDFIFRKRSEVKRIQLTGIVNLYCTCEFLFRLLAFTVAEIDS